MTSKKQTLADYLQKKEAHRTANMYQGLSQTQRQRLQYFDAKKKKVGLLLNDILYQVKKSQINEENYSKIQKMIKAAADQIKIQFDNTNKFTEQKAKQSLSQIDNLSDYSTISFGSKDLKTDRDFKVLQQIKGCNQIPTKQESEKGKTNSGKQMSRAKQNSRVPQVRSRNFIPQGK